VVGVDVDLGAGAEDPAEATREAAAPAADTTSPPRSLLSRAVRGRLDDRLSASQGRAYLPVQGERAFAFLADVVAEEAEVAARK